MGRYLEFGCSVVISSIGFSRVLSLLSSGRLVVQAHCIGVAYLVDIWVTDVLGCCFRDLLQLSWLHGLLARCLVCSRVRVPNGW